jgi:hypothetical protein
MRLAVTIARKPGEDWSVTTGPEVPLTKQRADFKALVAAGGEGYEQAILLTTTGVEKRKTFKQPLSEDQ